MKRIYLLSYSFNGVCHQAEVENVGSCLGSLVLAANAGRVEKVTIRSINA